MIGRGWVRPNLRISEHEPEYRTYIGGCVEPSEERINKAMKHDIRQLDIITY